MAGSQWIYFFIISAIIAHFFVAPVLYSPMVQKLFETFTRKLLVSKSSSPKSKKSPAKMRLIGAGFGRTGTMSLMLALNRLGVSINLMTSY